MFELTNLIGVWNTTNIQTIPLILLVHVFLNGNEFAGYVEVPEKNLKIRIDIFDVKNSKVDFNMTSIKSSFQGYLNGSVMKGLWRNTSTMIPINFRKINNISKFEVYRPQTPKRPFKYLEEEVEIKNLKANITLSGTFTFPKNRKPLAGVVLCHGSGGHDRDVTMFDHKPFMVLADYLSNNGIAVLRFDERGIRKSTGDFSSADFYDFADDVIEGIKYLKERKETMYSNIGVIGHSKGGQTAIIASSKSKLIKFMVLLGTVSVPAEENFYEQIRLTERAKNSSENLIEATIKAYSYTFKMIKSDFNASVVKNKLESFFETSGEINQDLKNLKNQFLNNLNEFFSPMLKSAINFEPEKILSRIKLPVLGIWGTKNLIVPPSINLIPMKKALESAKNKKFKLFVVDGLNHAMQTSAGTPNEYKETEETISLFLLQQIKNWIKKLFI